MLMVRSSILFSGASLPHMDSLTMTTPATDTVVSNIDAHDPKWRGNSHQFKDIPPTVQAYIQKQLDLSQIHSALLLPDKHLSVLDLAHCSFPSISPHSFITYAPTKHSFFSRESDHGDTELLSQTPVPPLPVVKSLLSQIEQRWLDGVQSISLPSGESLFPLWAIRFWNEVHMIAPIRNSWQLAVTWLQ